MYFFKDGFIIKTANQDARKKSLPRSIHPVSAACLVLFAFCLLASCATVTPEQEKEAEFYYKMGLSFLNEGQLQMAFVQFQKALQLDPENKETLNNLGLIYLRWEDPEKAKEFFTNAIKKDDRFSDAYNNLGVTCRELGQWQEAVDAFKAALSDPLYKFPELALYNLGATYYRAGQFDLAVENYKDSLKRSPSFPLPYYGLATAYNKMGRYGDAAAVLNRAIEIDNAYKGDRKKFVNDVRQRLLTAKGAVERDLKDYLEIMRY